MSDDRVERPENYNRDDDVPFHLPRMDEEEDTGNIHKEDTEDIVIPQEYLEETLPREVTTETETVQHAAQDDQRTVPNPAMREDADDDNDVPFRLPYNDPTKRDPTAPLGTKFVTMPSDPLRSAAHTLPGTGGLDPNPDYQAMNTVPHQVQPQPTQPQNRPYMRPQGQPAQQTQARGIPPVPQQVVPANRPLPRRRTRRRPNVGCLALFIGLFVTFCGGLTLVTIIAGTYAYARVGELLNERIEEVDRYAAFQSTFLYDRNGVELYEVFNEGRRTNVNLDQMPQYLIDATIAIEDDSFYRNIGIDIPATTVALLSFLGAAEDEQTAGGSTITQQLVRNVLFDPEYRAERSPQRKAEEIMLAVGLTGRKSKDEILELYLNEIYYGNLAYGVQAAAQVFFNKDVGELTLGEAALLAGLPQAPADLDPLNPDPLVQSAVQQRWRQVLGEMVDEGYITTAQNDQALRDGLEFNPQDVPLRAPHFTVYAQRQLEQVMQDLGYSPEQLARGGLHVYTSVDVRINDEVQQIAREQVASLSANNISNAAVVVLKPITGEVLAMVGSIDYNNDAIDGRVNVTTAVRQPGSTMKAFTYAAALERGMTPSDVIWDTRTSIGIPGQEQYVPRNYDGAFHGPTMIRYALANSYNIPAVQTLRYVGVEYLLGLMQRFGVESLGGDASLYGLSLTLGGGEISPLELTRGYTVFANGGALVDSQAIICVLDNDDTIIYQYENGCPRGNITEQSTVRAGLGKQVLDPRIAFLISDMLGDNDARSSAMGARSDLFTPGIVSSVKTGTTNDVKDNWTVGFTRNVAIGVWVGNNNGDPMRNSSGLTGAAPIWNRALYAIYNTPEYLDEFRLDGQLLPDERQAPAGISYRQICDKRRLTDPAAGCERTVNEWLLDSPAGIPDENGTLYYPPANDVPFQQIPGSGSYVQQVEPGLYRTTVFSIPPEISAGIQFNVGIGERQPPPPKYCRVPVELVATTPNVREQFFLAPPPVQADAVEAEIYAQQNGIAFLPTIDCTLELLAAQGSYPQNILVTGVITSPQPGETITVPFGVIGTANFPADQGIFYLLRIRGGQWGDWTPLHDVIYSPVINGQLQVLSVAIPPGSYELSLVIIANGNDALPPYVVPFNVQ